LITFNLLGRYGRMGNQMFQYATLFSIAKTRGYEFGVPYKIKSTNPYLNFCLNECFANLTAKDSSGILQLRNAKENSFEYSNGIFGIPDQTDIVGYFQSEKYFKNYRNDLLNEYKFKDEIENKAIDMRSITKEPVISIHLRLGDYKKLVGKHPICDIKYYKAALELIPKDLLIIVFSDEPELAKSIFDELNRKYFISDSNNQYTDMCLMTKCDYHVIANSSFSWWGAWLADTKKVVAPATWFGDSPEMPKNWSDIYCEGWEII
jgi:hypothetical protein